MPKIRRICFYGGPGSGKSTISAWLFAELKSRSLNVELVTEFVKYWAWSSRPVRSFDQFYLFATQLHREDVPLANGAELIITDCPLCMTCVYSRKAQLPACDALVKIAFEFNRSYPALNLFLDRAGLGFSDEGRFHNYQDSLQLDKDIEQFLSTGKIDYKKVKATEREAVLDCVLGALEKNDL